MLSVKRVLKAAVVVVVVSVLKPTSGVFSWLVTAVAVGDLLGAYEQLGAGVAAHLDAEFLSLPDAPLLILATDISPEPAAPLSYLRAAGGRPAVLYVDTAVPGAKPAIASFLQHAQPGMHLQDSLQRAANLPRFRRFNMEPAFVEGWGLYAATLGEELDLYPDEAAKSQLAALRMRCAPRFRA